MERGCSRVCSAACPPETAAARHASGLRPTPIARAPQGEVSGLKALSLLPRPLQRCAAAPHRRPRRSGAAAPRRARLRARLRRALVRLRRDREIEPGPQRRHGRDGGVDARACARLSEASAAARLDPVGLVQDFPARRLGLHPARGRDACRPASGWRSSSCAEWLAREKLAAVPFLLAAIPFYNFLGLKFDQNSVLIPLWALAMWAMLRALDTRHLGWAALAGLAAAAAMLSKYWSVFLHRRARARGARRIPSGASISARAAPWVTAGVFLAAVAPHVWWLIRENFPPITWVTSRRVARVVRRYARARSATMLGGTAAYAGVAIALVLFFVRPSPRRARRRLFSARRAARAPRSCSGRRCCCRSCRR